MSGKNPYGTKTSKNCLKKDPKGETHYVQIAEEVKKQNLNFPTGHSKIREIDEVMGSLNQMKSDLKSSLEKQWNMELSRKTQISALAHDIKTPLTIIKGNAELIREMSLNTDQIICNDYIMKSTEEIEHYLKALIDMIKSEDALILNKVRIKTGEFIRKLIEQAKALASNKNLQLIYKEESVPEYFYADEELLFRAFMNVIINAAEYSNKNGTIFFNVSEAGKNFSF